MPLESVAGSVGCQIMREAHFMFSEQESLVMVMAVSRQEYCGTKASDG